MNVTVNGKKFTINPNIKFGLFKRLMSGDDDPEVLEQVLKSALKPKPTKKELDNMDMEQIIEIMVLFQEAQKGFLTDIKKKLST